MNRYRFILKGLTCSNCAMKIEEKMGSYPFVESSVMNFIAQELTITLKDESKAGELLDIVKKTVDKIEDGITVVQGEDSFTMPRPKSEVSLKHRFHLEGLTCSHCAMKIEEKMGSYPFVESSVMNFITQELTITLKDTSKTAELLDIVQNTVDKIEDGITVTEIQDGAAAPGPAQAASCGCAAHASGHGDPHHDQGDCGHVHQYGDLCSCEHHHSYECEEQSCSCGHDHGGEHSLSHEQKSKSAGAKDEHGHEHPKKSYTEIGLLIISAVLMIVGMFFDQQWVRLLIYGASALLAGYKIYWTGFKSIIRLRFDENLLVLIAVVAAFCVGEYAEAALVSLLFRAGMYLEDIAVSRSRKEIESVTKIRPDDANLILGDGSQQKVDARALQIGDRIAIRPGEKVPVDCVVYEGRSSVDTSVVTGESLPVDIEAGSKLLSGMVNLGGLVLCTVENVFEKSTASRIIQLVQESAAQKGNTERFISRFAKVYTPIIILSAIVVALLPPLLLNQPFETWIMRSLVFLVASCPCALVISVPLSFFAGIGSASKNGVLVKGGKFMETLSHAKNVVFDKTGTLTTGKLKVSEIVPEQGHTKEEVLHIAAVAESYSNHPIAQSIVAQAGDLSGVSSENYEEIAGMGIRVTIDGKEVLCGAKRLMDKFAIAAKETDANIFVAVDKKLIGTITVSDQLRDDSSSAISALRGLGVERTVMLTGDNEKTAEKIAAECGVDEHYSSLMPADKVEHLKEIKARGGATLFVGDGINDAPVLAIADAGVAMGLGTDAAIEAADVVLMSDRPSALVRAIEIAKHAMRIVKFNIAFALIVKIGVLALGILGLANMWMAVFADVGVSIIAVINSTRILFDHKK